jgi:hypothetical protein
MSIDVGLSVFNCKIFSDFTFSEFTTTRIFSLPLKLIVRGELFSFVVPVFDLIKTKEIEGKTVAVIVADAAAFNCADAPCGIVPVSIITALAMAAIVRIPH